MLKELYNKSYQKFTPDFLADRSRIDVYLKQNADSLHRFLTSYLSQFEINPQGLCLLELGCGLGGLGQLMAQKFEQVIGVDFSPLAISQAKSINPYANLNFIQADVLSSELNQKFDFIVDSHLYHCLTTKKERELYLDFVARHLQPNGIFLMECMVFQERMQIPIGYEFTKDFVLHQEIEHKTYPVRSIRPARSIEEDFMPSKLSLNYFYYHDELAFQAFEFFPDHPHQFSPKTIRLSAKFS